MPVRRTSHSRAWVVGCDICAEVGAENLVFIKVGRETVERDPAAVEEYGPRGHLQCSRHILLDNQKTYAGGGEFLQRSEQLLDHQRGQAHRQLIQQDNGRRADVGSGEGEHLLLSSGQASGELSSAL